MTNENPNIRWKQRFSNYRKALVQLKKFVDKKNLSDLEQQGLVKAFEYTYELAWNVMKDYYEYQGSSAIQGSRDAIRLAFSRGLIEDGNSWIAMIQSRSLTAHVYNEDIAAKIADVIINKYFDLFIRFEAKMYPLFLNSQTKIFDE